MNSEDEILMLSSELSALLFISCRGNEKQTKEEDSHANHTKAPAAYID